MQAPLIPYLTGQNDTRNYTSARNLPLAQDMPGLFEGTPTVLQDPFDPESFEFLDF